MAIDINKVYTTVLSILNKKGSGYLTPDDFNKTSKIVQLDLLEKSFFDYNKAITNRSRGRGGEGYADIPTKIQDKIDPFYATGSITLTNGIGSLPVNAVSGLTDVYSIINISANNRLTDVERINKAKLVHILSSPLTAPSETFPVYYQTSNSIAMLPQDATSSVVIDYIRKPTDPIFGFTTNTSQFGTPVYSHDVNSSKNFVLHPSEEVDLILGILQYSGIIIKDQTVVQNAMNEKQIKNSQEK